MDGMCHASSIKILLVRFLTGCAEPLAAGRRRYKILPESTLIVFTTKFSTGISKALALAKAEANKFLIGRLARLAMKSRLTKAASTFFPLIASATMRVFLGACLKLFSCALAVFICFIFGFIF